MNKQLVRALLIPLLLLALAGLACGLSESKEKVETVAAVAPTLINEAQELAATGQAAATQLAPTLEAAATQMAPVIEEMATEAVELAGALAPTADAVIATLPPLPIGTPEGGIEEFLQMVQGSDGLSGLESFRMTSMLGLDGGGQTGQVDYWGEFTTAPQANHGKVTLSGTAAGGLPLPTFEYIIIEGQTWVKPGLLPWVQTQDSVQTFTGQQPYSADDFLFALPNAQRVLPDQTVNNIACQHYVYTIQDYQLETGVIHQASGEIYTALQGGYVVQYTLSGEATLDQFFWGQRGIINLDYNVFDVNSGINIQAP